MAVGWSVHGAGLVGPITLGNPPTPTCTLTRRKLISSDRIGSPQSTIYTRHTQILNIVRTKTEPRAPGSSVPPTIDYMFSEPEREKNSECVGNSGPKRQTSSGSRYCTGTRFRHRGPRTERWFQTSSDLRTFTVTERTVVALCGLLCSSIAPQGPLLVFGRRLFFVRQAARDGPDREIVRSCERMPMWVTCRIQRLSRNAESTERAKISSSRRQLLSTILPDEYGSSHARARTLVSKCK